MKTLWVNLQFALYATSVIVGAGVLTMPLTGRLLGFVPLLVLTVLVALWLVFIYRRLVQTLFSNVVRAAEAKTTEMDNAIARGMGIRAGEGWQSFFKFKMIAAEARKGAALFDDVIGKIGIGSAGHATLLVGMFFTVFFADIGYSIIGARSLGAVAVMLKGYGSSLSFGFLAGGGALILIALGLPAVTRRRGPGRGAAQKLLMMAGWWCVTVGLLNVIPWPNETIRSVLSFILFLFAILSSMLIGADVSNTESNQGGLNAQHRVNVVVVSIEIALLLVAGVLIIGLFFNRDMIGDFYSFASGWSDASRLADWSRVLGIVLFAYTTTGFFNLCAYPQLFKEGGRLRFDRVVALGTLISLVLYLGWITVSALTLSPGELALADAQGEPTHIIIAAKAGAGVWAWGITLTGYVFALMAVTTACSGYTESLADRIKITLHRIGRRRGGQPDFRPVILASAVAVAVMKEVFSVSIDLSAILSIAGTVGGGLLVLILPFFFPYPPRRSRVRYWEIAVVLATAAILVVSILSEPATGAGLAAQVIAWVKGAAVASLVLMVGWLLLSEPEEPEELSGRGDTGAPSRLQAGASGPYFDA